MASFLRRIIDLIKASLNSLIDRAEDPETMLAQMMRDMQSSYERSKVEVARVLAEKHRLLAKLGHEEGEAEGWGRKAMLALQAGDEALARRALERKRSHTQVAESFREQVQAQAQAAESLKDALRKLEDKIAEAGLKRSLLSARHRRAVAQQRIHRALEATGSSTAFENLARLEARIEDVEADTFAAAELSSGSGSNLDEQFRQLEATDVEEDLLLLKAKMQDAAGLLTEGSDPENGPPDS